MTGVRITAEALTNREKQGESARVCLNAYVERDHRLPALFLTQTQEINDRESWLISQETLRASAPLRSLPVLPG